MWSSYAVQVLLYHIGTAEHIRSSHRLAKIWDASGLLSIINSETINLNLIVLTKEKILATLRQNKPYFEKELGVIRIGLFGSYAKGLDKPNSDVDIFVELKQADYNALIDILILLENQLNTKIDLIRKGPHLRDKFLRTIEREIIYA